MENQDEKTVYKIASYGEDIEVIVVYGTYKRDGSLSVSLFCRQSGSDEFTDLFDVITVNLPESRELQAGIQFVDINNHPYIEDWLVRNDIAEPVEIYFQSGFCRYPAYRFGKSIK